jgi:hypothetical protein
MVMGNKNGVMKMAMKPRSVVEAMKSQAGAAKP